MRSALKSVLYCSRHQTPLSPYELYQRRLRGNKCDMMQSGCQSNEDCRSVEIQTEEIFCEDQEVQFQFGDDDTRFENLLSAMLSGQPGELAEALQRYQGETQEIRIKPSNMQSHFLRQSSEVFLRESSDLLFIFFVCARAFCFIFYFECTTAGNRGAADRDACGRTSKQYRPGTVHGRCAIHI